MAKGSGTERGFQALLESVRTERKAVAEGHGTLERQVLQTRMSLKQRIGFVEQAVSEGFVKNREFFAEVNGRLDQLVDRFDAHERAHTS